MGVRISDPRHVCLYCSTTGTAFGPVFEDSLEAEDFLSWVVNKISGDVRDVRDDKLADLYAELRKIREAEAA